jgi:hypothetical protein
MTVITIVSIHLHWIRKKLKCLDEFQIILVCNLLEDLKNEDEVDWKKSFLKKFDD